MDELTFDLENPVYEANLKNCLGHPWQMCLKLAIPQALADSHHTCVGASAISEQP